GLGHLERFLPGVGWSLAPGRIQQIALQRLDVFVQLLDRMPELEAIAEMLGRLEEADRREGTQDGGNEEVVGVHFSGEVRHALPSELGLLADPDTEDLFYTRWTEHRLVSLELSGAGLDGSGEGTTRGPFIVCLDASASMDGPPELASKALVLALCRRVLPQGRAVHVLMFGGRGQHLEVRIRRGRAALDGLLDVLTQSFDGGTDFDGPLLKALDMLQDQELHRSDILVVTDGHAVTAPYVDLRVQQVREALGLSVVSIIMGAGPTDGVDGFSDEVWRLAPSKLDGALGLLRNA
ncbi:MAG: VWA domain-containing protein, partial [Myxococcota bacterium]